MGKRVALFVFIFLAITLAGCADTAVANTSATSTPNATATPLAENLVFHGDISGTMTTGIDARPLTHDNPLPDLTTQADGTFFQPPPHYTQCSTFASLPGSDTIDDYVAVIVGTVDGKRYAVSVEINMDDPAYTRPGTKLLPGETNTGGSVQVYEAGGQNRSWQQVFGPNSQEAAVIVLGADRKSGTVDAWMASAALSQKGSPATLHLQGDWRCG
ncbi:MAG TPA: hypothetical protein VFX24_16090 [Ktedonobacterales bacterium]|jgi:hypothetical protein|nr:hypothetical protein [Ktedonobacterales bacterium]